MNFGDTFESLLTTEWRQQYMNYKHLKNMIYRAVYNAPTNTELHEEYYKEFEWLFFSVCQQELSRVENFSAQKMAEARRKYLALSDRFVANIDNNPHSKESSNLGLASSEFYLSLIMLQNFQSLNYTGFLKICTKYDKYLKSTNGADWFRKNVSTSEFAVEDELKKTIVKVEDLYIIYLTNGNRAKAMAKLRVPPLGRRIPLGQVFFAGVMLGLFTISAIIVIISLIYYSSDSDMIQPFIRLYRGPLACVLCAFYLTVNVYVWQNVGVNHVLIFGVDLRKSVPAATFLEVASGLGVIFALSMLFFIHHKEFEVEDRYHFPLMCLVLPLTLLIFPLPVCNLSTRLWILHTTGRIFGAPFFKVNFADFWMADQLTSMVLCIMDYYHLTRFYINFYKHNIKSLDFEPDFVILAIRILAPWFRFAQCLRRYYDTNYTSSGYILNALKYSGSIITVICSFIVMQTSHNYENMFQNTWLWIYLCSALLSTSYCTYWDFKNDFGLFRVWKGENIFLRENLVYPRSFYYFVIVSNVLIRYIWILELFLIYNNYLLPYYIKSIIGFCELTRRFLWNFIRLENEHLYNCGEFRATRDIYLELIDRTEHRSTLAKNEGKTS